MKVKFQWMLAVILMISGTLSFTSCKDDDNNEASEAVKAELVGEWYAEYDATGTVKDLSNEDVAYTGIIERYDFDADGTGQWSRYYMADQAFPVEELGGVQEGNFNYSVNKNGEVNIRFNEQYARDFESQRVINFTKGTLTATNLNGQQETFVSASDILVAAFNEWDGIFHMAADADGPEDLKDGNRIYGVGYGYNFILDHSRALSASPIIDMKYVDENHKRKTNGISAEISTELYTGHSLTEISNELSATANASGSICGFKGEVGAAFDASYRNSSEYEYAMFVSNISKTSVTMEVSRETTVANLDATFKVALQGLTERYKGQKGLYNLVSDYGTHFIYQARLGGRVRYTTTVDISQVSGEYDLSAYAKVSYEKLSFSAEGSVENKYRQAYSKNTSAINTKVSAMGGTMETLRSLAKNGTKTELDAWAATLDDVKNTVVVNVEKTIPIWDLVSNDENRAKEIEDYVKGGSYERDFSGDNNFVIGAMGKIESVSKLFSATDDATGTQIKQIKIQDGSVIAWACKEYIPQLNPDARSIVLYPVVNGKPKFNLGYFVGNNGTRPCRVCWSPKKAAPDIISLSREKNAGLKDELYVLGCSFLHSDIDKTTIDAGDPRKTEAVDYYLEATGLNEKGEKDLDHKYPLIKVFNHVWMRENLSYVINDDVAHKTSDNQVYYRHTLISESSYRSKLPSGWKLPTNTLFEDFIATLKALNVQSPARKMAKGGVMGFNAEWTGWMDGNTVKKDDDNTHFWGVEGNVEGNATNYLSHFWLRLWHESGNVDFEPNKVEYANHYYNVRLIQDITW